MKSKELKELESLERIVKIGFIVIVIIGIIGCVIMWKGMKSNYRNPFVGCTIEEAKVNPNCTMLYTENPSVKLNIINDEEPIKETFKKACYADECLDEPNERSNDDCDVIWLGCITPRYALHLETGEFRDLLTGEVKK